jgi:hypothetical protein
MSDLVSPNEMLDAACEMMLDGRRPVSTEDWALVVNFFAANIHPEVVVHAMPVLKAIYSIPLENDEIKAIVAFQLIQRE